MKDKRISRREFGLSAMGSFATVAFLQSLVTGCSVGKESGVEVVRAVAPKAAEVVKHWAAGLDEMSRDLKGGAVSPKEWQRAVERLFSRIELPDLLKLIDFEELKKGFEFPDLGVNTRKVVFPKIAGIPEKTVFVKKIFGMKKGKAIVPHGHSNMASAHLILQGEFHLRHYEKLVDEGGRLSIRPTIDRTSSIGDASSISDEMDNVHWFVANSNEAFTFDVIVLDLDGEKYDIHNLDMSAAERTEGGVLSVPKIDVKTALKKYGKQHHDTGV